MDCGLGVRRGSRPVTALPRNRWFEDSLLEGTGFELSVPLKGKAVPRHAKRVLHALPGVAALALRRGGIAHNARNRRAELRDLAGSSV